MKRSAWLSLALLVPAPSIGVLFGMILYPGSAAGQGIFMFSKVWILLLPALWLLLVEKDKPRFGKTGKDGFRVGLLTGLAISAFVLAASFLTSSYLIDADFFKEMMGQIGLNRKAVYIGGAVYWTCVNSVLEEYVWRWFVVRQCMKLMKPSRAVVVSALFFTLHHILAMQVYFNPALTAICTVGIFIGGALWSWMFTRYGTIWPGWLSHALVDAAIFISGYLLLFS
ncbi:MAG: CPBP family intramembrane metalloprotease [Kiritimatiellales bacterium]|nr:CPBP family intramembrane metalloprotease [Kiritimatiellales bacterium]